MHEVFYIFGGLLGSALLALYWFQNNLLYYPSMPPGSRTDFDHPSRFDLKHSEHYLTTADNVKIQTWFFAYHSTAPTILYFHGNAGNISHRLVRIQHFLRALQCNILIVSYRGYGRSEGSPSEKGLRLDAQAALDFLLSHPDIDPKKIIVYGESLGGAVAIQLAADNEEKIACLVVENTFLSIPDMIDVIFPVLSHVKWLSQNQWKSSAIIGQLQLPILFLSGEQDELVPPKMMKALFEASSSRKKELKLFAVGHHNDTWLSPGYYSVFWKFIASLGLAFGPEPTERL